MSDLQRFIICSSKEIEQQIHDGKLFTHSIIQCIKLSLDAPVCRVKTINRVAHVLLVTLPESRRCIKVMNSLALHLLPVLVNVPLVELHCFVH